MKLKPSSFYWNIIAGMGWAEATLGDSRVDCDAIKRDFMETYSEQTAIAFDEWYRAKYKELVNAYDANEKETGKRYGNFGGDDSFGDMLDHVMGLGEEYYCAVMADFRLLNNLDPVESFAYCIPHTGENINDYDDLKPETHKANALRAIKDIAEVVTEADDVSERDMRTLAETMQRLFLIASGDFTAGTHGITFDKDYNRFYDLDTRHLHAGAANCIFDAKKYMAK